MKGVIEIIPRQGVNKNVVMVNVIMMTKMVKMADMIKLVSNCLKGSSIILDNGGEGWWAEYDFDNVDAWIRFEF